MRENVEVIPIHNNLYENDRNMFGNVGDLYGYELKTKYIIN